MTTEKRLELEDLNGETADELKRIGEQDLLQERCSHENTIISCPMCGNEPEGEDTDMMFCRYCKDHTVFEEVCLDCEKELGEIE